MTKKEFVLSERQFLIKLLKQLSPKQWHYKTLCEGWSIDDLAAHIVARESSTISNIGIVVPIFHSLHDKRIAKIKAKGHDYIISKLEQYPWWMPAVANTAEFYIHNEDILRSQLKIHRPEPSKEAGEILWQSLKGLTTIRKDLVSDLGSVQLENIQTGAVLTLENKRKRKDTVVSGLPGELLLFVYGRRSAAKVKITTAKI